MTWPVVQIDGASLIGRDAFHDTFAEKFGFLDGYGRNMDAWIDCMGYMRDPGLGMTRVSVGPDQTLTICLSNYDALRDKAPEQWRGLIEATGSVNRREMDRGERPLIALAF